MEMDDAKYEARNRWPRGETTISVQEGRDWGCRRTLGSVVTATVHYSGELATPICRTPSDVDVRGASVRILVEVRALHGLAREMIVGRVAPCQTFEG